MSQADRPQSGNPFASVSSVVADANLMSSNFFLHPQQSALFIESVRVQSQSVFRRCLVCLLVERQSQCERRRRRAQEHSKDPIASQVQSQITVLISMCFVMFKCTSLYRSQSSAGDRMQDETSSDTMSLRSSIISADSAVSSAASGSAAAASKAHNFIRTHFHRATQCDFCGKKIWLKDAMQCKDCSMCCHKKCIAKCQNATVCGPVDCYAPGPSGTPVNKPEFTITQADYVEMEEPAKGSSSIATEDIALEPEPPLQQLSLDVHRSSLTGMLAQGIKRQASNLDIPGIVSSLSGNNTPTNSKSLPPSPQHTPSR